MSAEPRVPSETCPVCGAGQFPDTKTLGHYSCGSFIAIVDGHHSHVLSNHCLKVDRTKLLTRIEELEGELEGYRWQICPSMVQAKFDELNKAIAKLKDSIGRMTVAGNNLDELAGMIGWTVDQMRCVRKRRKAWAAAKKERV